MIKGIAKSPEVQEKEEQIKNIYKQIKKERTTLKSLKTKLENTKKKISDIQREIFNSQQNVFDKLDNLYKETKELLLHCRKFNNLSDEDLELLDAFAKVINEGELLYDDEQEKQEEYFNSEDFEEEHKRRVSEIFSQFKVEPPAEEKKQIRKIYLKLSKRFHPDKAQTENDRKSYHSVMQQIIEAYESNAIDKLLEYEQSYQNEGDIDLTDRAITVDLLLLKINKLERDLNFIKQQTIRTSEEIKTIRHSEMGHMLSDFKKMEKGGFSLEQFKEEQEQILVPVEMLLDALKVCKKEKRMDKLYEELEHFDNLFYQDEIGSLFDFDDDEDDFFDLDNDEDDLERIPVKNPKFPVGSSVKIKKDLFLIDEIPWNLRDQQGRIKEAYWEDSEIVYDVELDSKALKEIPIEILDFLVDTDPEFNLISMYASDLKKSKPRDSKPQAVSAYRTMLHRRMWEHLNKNEIQKMEDILLKRSTKSDVENWNAAFSEYFDFPMMLTTRAVFPLPPNIAVQVIALKDYESGVGHKFEVKYEGNFLILPVVHFKSKNRAQQQILKLYDEWLDWHEWFD